MSQLMSGAEKISRPFLRLTASQAKISQPHDAVRLDLVVEEQAQTSQYADVPVVVHLRELV